MMIPISRTSTSAGMPTILVDCTIALPRRLIPVNAIACIAGGVFMSDQIWFQRVINARDGLDGSGLCPTPNCDGKGFTFDIFPTDPNHPANEGWHFDDDFDEDLDDPERQWDPDESKYKELDEELDDADDDIAGEEWKFGLEPGQQPQETPWAEEARKQWSGSRRIR